MDGHGYRQLVAEYRGAAGTTEVSCAVEGLDLLDLPSDEISVVESGPKTFTIQAADAVGNTVTRTVTVEIIENAESASARRTGGALLPGHTYYYFGLFYEIPEGMRVFHRGVVEADDVYDHFADGSIEDGRWTTVLLDHEGNEGPFYRRVWRVSEQRGQYVDSAPLTEEENEQWDRFLANIRTAPFPEGDPRNEPPIPLAPSARGAAGPRQNPRLRRQRDWLQRRHARRRVRQRPGQRPTHSHFMRGLMGFSRDRGGTLQRANRCALSTLRGQG